MRQISHRIAQVETELLVLEYPEMSNYQDIIKRRFFASFAEKKECIIPRFCLAELSTRK